MRRASQYVKECSPKTQCPNPLMDQRHLLHLGTKNTFSIVSIYSSQWTHKRPIKDDKGWSSSKGHCFHCVASDQRASHRPSGLCSASAPRASPTERATDRSERRCRLLMNPEPPLEEGCIWMSNSIEGGVLMVLDPECKTQ